MKSFIRLSLSSLCLLASVSFARENIAAELSQAAAGTPPQFTTGTIVAGINTISGTIGSTYHTGDYQRVLSASVEPHMLVPANEWMPPRLVKPINLLHDHDVWELLIIEEIFISRYTKIIEAIFKKSPAAGVLRIVNEGLIRTDVWLNPGDEYTQTKTGTLTGNIVCSHGGTSVSTLISATTSPLDLAPGRYVNKIPGGAFVVTCEKASLGRKRRIVNNTYANSLVEAVYHGNSIVTAATGSLNIGTISASNTGSFTRHNSVGAGTITGVINAGKGSETPRADAIESDNSQVAPSAQEDAATEKNEEL